MSLSFTSSEIFDLLNDSNDELGEVLLLCELEDYHNAYLTKQPCRNSALTGHDYVLEILNGNNSRCYEQLRMNKHVFLSLCNVLKEKELLENSRYITVEEQVAMFLYVISHNEQHRVVGERYQHSTETTSHCFHKVLKAICRLSKELITPPSFDTMPLQIRSNPKYYPFFKVLYSNYVFYTYSNFHSTSDNKVKYIFVGLYWSH